MENESIIGFYNETNERGGRKMKKVSFTNDCNTHIYWMREDGYTKQP